MKRFIGPRGLSARYRRAVEALRLVAQEEGLDQAQRAVGEALSDLRKDAWVKGHSLKPTDGSVFWSELLGKRPSREEELSRLPGDDHVTLWLKDGKPDVYVSQPYALGLDTLREMAQMADKHGLDVHVDAKSSWWFPGYTLFIEWRRAHRKGRGVLTRERRGRA